MVSCNYKGQMRVGGMVGGGVYDIVGRRVKRGGGGSLRWTSSYIIRLEPGHRCFALRYYWLYTREGQLTFHELLQSSQTYPYNLKYAF